MCASEHGHGYESNSGGLAGRPTVEPENRFASAQTATFPTSVRTGTADPVTLSEAQVQENMWIEIIRKMESIYAELATVQSEVEAKSNELSQSKEFADNVIHSMANALVVADPAGTITMVNDAAVQLLGYDEQELVGFPLKALFFEAETAVFYRGSPMWRELVERGYVRDRELVCRAKDGSRMPVSFSGSVMRDAKGEAVGVICVAEDLRESKRLLAEAAAAAEAERAKSAELEAAYRELQNLQTHLVQTEKMTSLGRMAAGIAHEINNPLGGIVIYSHLLLEDMPPDDPKRRNLENIVKEATRCGEIVKGLLGFARPQVAAGQLLDPGRVLMDSLSVLNGQALFHNIEVRTDIEPNLPHVPGDAGQIQQAFMNMIFNAADAMEGKGSLVLKAHADTKNEAVKVSISDTGPGIQPENISRLFEPFFTTKPPGRGLGLGLAITYGIIKQHGGTIDVETEVGRGTSFEVRLPCNVTVP